jgi:hypothetical protein
MLYYKPQDDPSGAALYFQRRRVHSDLPRGSLREFVPEVMRERTTDSEPVIKFLVIEGSSRSSATVLLWRRCSNKSNALHLPIPLCHSGGRGFAPSRQSSNLKSFCCP